MDEALRTKVLEIGELAKELPDNLQLPAFELLLSHYLSEQATQKPHATGTRVDAPKDTPEPPPPDVAEKSGKDLQLSDLHMKAKRFLEKSNISLDEVNQLFYMEGDSVTPLYEDLKTTKIATMQINLTLLMAFRQALISGAFEVNGEDVREECKARKCYDLANFARAFANNKELFDGFDQYSKEEPILRLSEPGRAQLAALVKALN